MRGLWERVRASFWFLPAGMAAGAILLAFLTVALDARIGGDALRRFGWLYTFGPEGARALLSAIASSMITVAAVTFSITMLTLQLASSQFGPRLLRNFMRDRGTQLVLGTFIATFAYCLLVLRTVRGTEDAHFVPHLAVMAGMVMALASIAVLIFFVHHVASSIRIETLLARLSAETLAAVDRLYPARMGKAPSAGSHALPPDFETAHRAVPAGRGGYVERILVGSLVEIAAEFDLVLRIAARPGVFVKTSDALLLAYPASRVSDEIAARLASALAIGSERTPEQDLEFSLRRIVEIAQRALSPGVNDPTTALYCLDRIGEALARLAERDLPSPHRADDAGRLRVVTEVRTLTDIACPALAAVARYGVGDADVAAKLVAILDMLLPRAPLGERHALETLRESIRDAAGACTPRL
ncbi:MAG: DUF2254 domain-containing protein [Alphaproteobacteria bacterium]